MMRFVLIEILVVAAAAGTAYSGASRAASEPPIAGSASCRDCHEQFYKLWASSHHGLAMQPYTAAFAGANLTDQADDIEIGVSRYRAEIEPGKGWVRETGPEGQRTYPIVQVLGGKNVYYFLTPHEKGRLQTLPVAYDVNEKHWFDTAASGVRHFPGADNDQPVHWTDPFYTFNTSCHGCHVSQLSTNYDLKTDTYHTTWAEPGINCETCHGPADQHVKLYRQAAVTPSKPGDLGLVSTKSFSVEQTNSMCNTCHAKLSAVSASFTPGDEYFDHFNLIALEHPDFYPDGRDLGENYTMTSWRMSPCVKGGKLDCMHCHTSSGRYRFEDRARANDACKPCHKERVENAEPHTHHPVDSEAGRCIACHMPMTKFAHMNRSDHSMRPPAPAATLAFKSPNACNLCHTDQDAAWADKYVRQWHNHDYQNDILEPAHLVDEARRGNWANLDKILQYISTTDRDEMFAVSLVRLLRSCDSPKKWPGIVRTLKEDPSPLVRAGAAETLDGYLASESLEVLLGATSDNYRLVRVRAAASLAGIGSEGLRDEHQKDLQRATAEYLEALQSRADDYVNHYNLGNFYLARRQTDQAIRSFETAIKLRPDYLASHVNAAFAYNAAGRNDEAEASFRRALELDPNSVAVHLNLGMLLGEQSRLGEAEDAFRRALKVDPKSAVAAYNLGVILAPKHPPEALKWCGKAYRLRPDEPKYGYTYAYYLYQSRDVDKAIGVLQAMVKRQVPSSDAYALLGAIYQGRGELYRAIEAYRAATKNNQLPQSDRSAFETMIQRLR
ncbi:MAG: tetratricopeptide repeat protein [Phycisphaerae bacterium]|nr:tetratricopeptide repeat protein [Phycisphaerae bacterium]